MKIETLKEQAERIKQEMAYEEELKKAPICEKCGGEMTVKMIGDESYNHCPDCNWFTH